MSYFLRRATLGPQFVIEIDEARYNRLASARETLIDAGTFEQHYELLLGNFKAYEMYCAQVSLQASVELDFGYDTWSEILSEANRNAINFLATTKMYADQVGRNFKHLELEEPFAEQAAKRLSEAYDNTIAYRFLCELRNHVQHRALAIHGSRGSGKKHSWLERTSLQCHKARIEEDQGKFKQRVLDELPEQIDVLEMFREYMGAVSQVHVVLRKSIEPFWVKARSDIQEAMVEFAKAQRPEDGPKPALGPTACWKEGDKWIRPVLLLLDWDDARLELSTKNAMRIRLPMDEVA